MPGLELTPASDNRTPVAHLPFFFSTFAWNYGLGMTWLAVPLYAHALGLSAAEIGLLFAVPAVVQMTISLVGGAYTDRIGGRGVMQAACLCMALGGGGLVLAEGFWSLFAGQVLMVLSRAAFWPANWALASELPGRQGVQVGRLNAISSFAQILGNASCGFLLAAAGYKASLAGVGVLGAAAFVLALATPRGRSGSLSRESVFANYLRLARMPVMYYGILCAYFSSLPMTLATTFYPLLLKEFGYGEEASGVLLALRALGGICAGLIIGRFVSGGAASRWPLIGGAGVALGVGLLPLFPHWTMVGTLMLAVGICGGIMTLYVQITMSEATSVEMRGSALALAGLGWSISHLTTPLVAGFLAQYFGTASGFYALGGLAGLLLAVIAGVRGRVFAASRRLRSSA